MPPRKRRITSQIHVKLHLIPLSFLSLLQSSPPFTPQTHIDEAPIFALIVCGNAEKLNIHQSAILQLIL